MTSINSLASLLDSLDHCEPQDYVKIVSRMQLPKEDFDRFSFWKPDGYTRNCIKRTQEYELVLICWNPGDITSVHGHNQQRCWVYQVDGAISEQRFEMGEQGQLKESQYLELTSGELSYMNDKMGYHALENRSQARARSLHLYISPIDSCQVFDDSNSQFNTKQLEYDSYDGVLLDRIVS
ncbi:MAG: cysteine dioxygenase family protein [Gilvibacter sp.]